MTLAAYIPTGPFALLVSFAILGAGCLVVFLLASAWLALTERRDRKRRGQQRGRHVPEHVHRQPAFREPPVSEDFGLPESRLTDEDLRGWYAMESPVRRSGGRRR